MKALVAVALAVVLLFGCAQKETDKPGNITTEAVVNNASGSAMQGQAGNGTIAPVPTMDTTGVMMADYTPPEMPHFDFANVTTPNGTLIVYYFHSSKCSACNALQPEIDRLRAGHTDVLWLDYDIATPNGRHAYEDFAAQRNLNTSERMVPQVLVNGSVITDRFKINATLEGIILGYRNPEG
ncbi:MAG: hypothetical protein PHV13_00390 [Candidatus ainarchaeum sp.]|nr:hypothetical protein [Candidatus ainarchaeum sp.]